jgi:zinc transport system ATP-binding protein
VTVKELVSAGRVPRRGVLRPFSGKDRAAVRGAIDRVGLLERADTPVHRLSGGQRQRAHIAKALAGEPDLIVLDEPTAGVDVEAQDAFAELLEELHVELGATILYVSHEFGAVERFVERLVLVSGGIVFDGPPSALPGLWHDPSHVHP